MERAENPESANNVELDELYDFSPRNLSGRPWIC